MNSIIEMLINIFSPVVFWPIIGVITLIFVVVVIVSTVSDKKSKDSDDLLKKKIKELGSELSSREAELNNFKDRFNTKDAEGRKQLVRLEEQVNENELTRTKLKNLEASLKEKDDVLAREKNAREELNKKLITSAPEIENAKKEVVLKQQMYDGLKSEYDELEAQVADKTKKLQEEVEKNKKLQDELKNLQAKLVESANKFEQALKKASEASLKEKAVLAQPSAAASIIEPAKKEERAEIKKAEAKSIEKPPQEIPPSAPKDEQKPVGISVAQVMPQRPKPPVQSSDVDKQKVALDSADRSKAAPVISAKVRLAQVMQEAAKVAAKIEAAKNPQENKEAEKEKKEGLQNPPKP